MDVIKATPNDIIACPKNKYTCKNNHKKKGNHFFVTYFTLFLKQFEFLLKSALTWDTRIFIIPSGTLYSQNGFPYILFISKLFSIETLQTKNKMAYVYTRGEFIFGLLYIYIFIYKILML